MSIKVGRSFYIQFFINATDLAAGTGQELIAPTDGFIEELQTTVQAAIGTGGGITVNINGVAVNGLSATVADSAAAGTRNNDTPNSPDPTRQFKKGDRITIIPAAAFATSGAVNGNLLCRANATIDA